MIRPAKVGKITASSTSTSLTLKRDKVSGASSYVIYKYDSSQGACRDAAEEMIYRKLIYV